MKSLPPKPIKIVHAQEPAAFLVFFENIKDAGEFGSMLSLISVRTGKAWKEFSFTDFVEATSKAKSFCLWTKKEKKKRGPR